MPSWRAAVLAAGLWAGAAQAGSGTDGASPGTVERLLARLGRLGRGARTLQARFVQRKRLALFATEVVTRGVCRYRHPDAIRWETFPPDESVVLVRGKELQVRTPGEKPTKLALDRSPVLAGLIEELFIWLGVRPAAGLRERYEITLDEKRSSLRLRPRRGPIQKRIREVRIALGSGGEARKITIAQVDGDSTTIELGAVERDLELPESTFE